VRTLRPLGADAGIDAIAVDARYPEVLAGGDKGGAVWTLDWTAAPAGGGGGGGAAEANHQAAGGGGGRVRCSTLNRSKPTVVLPVTPVQLAAVTVVMLLQRGGAVRGNGYGGDEMVRRAGQ
jgi:hypothetical protein